MSTSIIVPLVLLLTAVGVAWLLAKAKAFGPITVAGFVLGGLATGSVYSLLLQTGVM